MSITKQLKEARGYSRTGFQVYHEISDGRRPALGDVAKPANWLPVLLEDQYKNEWLVMLAGTIVSMVRDASAGIPNRIVPANGGTAMNIVYTDSDVGYTVDVDAVAAGDPSLVTAAKTAGETLPTNKPIGWLWHHCYSGSVEARLINYDIQPFISIVCDYEVELALVDPDPLDNDVQNFEAGDFIKPGIWPTGPRAGVPHLWVNGVDSAEQICGRVLYRAGIPTGVNSRSRIDLERPVRGFGLSGMESNGRPRHLDAYMYGSTTTKATDFIRANILS